MSRLPTHRLIRALLRFGAAEDGANAVEFALVIPMLLALLFGVFEFGRGLWTQGLLDFAVQQAARCASINTTTCSSTTATTTYAASQTTPLNLPSSVFSASTTACGNLVTASYAFSFVSTFSVGGQTLFPTSVTLTSRSCYPS